MTFGEFRQLLDKAMAYEEKNGNSFRVSIGRRDRIVPDGHADGFVKHRLDPTRLQTVTIHTAREERLQERFGKLEESAPEVLAHTYAYFDAPFPSDAEALRTLLARLIASLTLAEHMGDVAEDCRVVLKHLGIEVPAWADMNEIRNRLSKLGVVTLHGTAI